jgi:hypothetical protein
LFDLTLDDPLLFLFFGEIIIADFSANASDFLHQMLPGTVQLHNAIPIIKVQPFYPPAAAIKGIEGWVKAA